MKYQPILYSGLIGILLYLKTAWMAANPPGYQALRLDPSAFCLFICSLFITGFTQAAPARILNNLQNSAAPISSLQAELDPGTLKSDMEKKLASANQKLAALPENQDSALDSAELGSDSYINQRRVYLKQLIYLYQGHFARLTNLQGMREKRLKLEHETNNWVGFKTFSAQPFLLADKLRDSVDRLHKRLDEIEALLDVTQKAEVYVMSTLEASTVKLRQADEKLEQAKDDSVQRAQLRRQRDQLELENQLDMARAIGLQIEKSIKSESALEIRSMLQLAKKQLGELINKFELTQAVLDQAYLNIEIEKQSIHAEINQVIAARDALQQQNLAQGPSMAQPSESSGMRQIRLIQLNNIDIKLQILNRILSYLDLQHEIWGQRWAFAKVTDRNQVRGAFDLIDKYQEFLKNIHQYILLHRKQAVTELTDLTNQKMTEGVSSAQDLSNVLDNPDFDQVISFSRLLNVVESTENLLARAKADLDKQFAVKSLQDSLADRWLEFVDLLANAWVFELFAVEDTIVVDGQTLTSQRSVTVSKVVTALAILIIGYWLAARVARLVERLAVTKLDIDPSLARIARRWMFFLEVLLLIVISMLVVRIPLTVFAFMGGAVAIGAGFGMQNLLKNLISGLMLLMERPFRPGDLIEVDGIRGRITDIGVRSSQILDANGIETLIPNSTLIEQNVTNWTLSDEIVRIVVNVSVAYGSSTKDVNRLLLEVAGRHGMVLQEPAPQVLFEDFGSDALMFGLYVWVQLKRDVSWKGIASDLRFMINRSFTEHGIIMAFPQRDVHLDTHQPIEVRVVSEPLDLEIKK